MGSFCLVEHVLASHTALCHMEGIYLSQAFVTQLSCYSSLLSYAVINGRKLQPNSILRHIHCVWVASTKSHHHSAHVQRLLFFSFVFLLCATFSLTSRSCLDHSHAIRCLYLVPCLKDALQIFCSYLFICFSSWGCIKTFNLILLFSYSYGPDFSFYTYKNHLFFAMSLIISAVVLSAIVFALFGHIITFKTELFPS